MRRLSAIVRNLLQRARQERDLDDEMRAMLEELTANNRRRGLDPSTARRAAAMALGIESVKTQVREARAGATLDALLRDVRYAARLLRRNPLFTTAAALSLAIGIGAVTAVFTIGQGLLRFSPEAVPDSSRLVEMGRSFDLPIGFNPGSYPDYLDIRARMSTLEHVFAHPLFPKTLSVSSASGLESVTADIVTTNYFAALGTRAATGRVFRPDDSDRLGASPFVVLSHRLWTRAFGANPAIVGATVRVNRYPMTVIGVAADGFHGTTIVAVDMWVPMSMVTFITPSTQEQLDARRAGWLVMGGRLKEGATLARAQQELGAIDRQLRVETAAPVNPRPLRMQAASPVAGNGPLAAVAIVLLGAITSTVLAIACANVAGLLLARASSRRRELALRLAIGSGRLRLVTQTLAETLLVSALGAIAGIALARMMTLALLSILPTLPLPVHLSASLDWRALAFALGLSLIGSLLSGLAPALLASRTDVATILKDEAQGPRLRLRSVFVVAQIALSVILLVIGGLFLRALAETRSRDAGLDPSGVEVASLDLTPGSSLPDSPVSVARDVLDRVRAVPSVEAASMARVLPLAAETFGVSVSVPGSSLPGQASSDITISGNIVEPEYFAVMRIPVRRGRDFTDRDGIAAPRVAIVGETAARRFWPGRDALGQTLSIGGPGVPVQDAAVIGIARDVPYSAIGAGPMPFVYLPLRQNSVPSMTLLVRSRPGQGSADRVRAAIATTVPDLPSLQLRPLDEMFAVSMLPQRLGAFIAGGLGIIGILLAAMGIYGVTANTVAQRTREFAIRTALGASRRDVGLLALRQAMLLTGIGSTIGLALAVPAGFVLSMLLLDVSPVDPVTFVAAVTLCGLVVLAACVIPVRRAVRVAAAQALKAD